MQQQISALAPTRTRAKTSFPSRTTKWSPQEDDLLLRIVKDQAKTNWNEIAPQFPGKTSQQISERWSKVVNPALVKGSWTRHEDEIIVQFVTKYGTKNWTKLASLLPGRIGKQCRERWRNHLDPSNTKEPWTPEEDEMLINLHNQYGNQWVKIASLMKGRSDNSIKNRWNSTLKKNPNATTVVSLKHSTPISEIEKMVIPPQTPSSIETLPTPNIEESSNETSFEQTSTGMTPKNFDLISPYSIRSPFGLASPYSFKPDGLLSPWGNMQGTSSDSLFSPRFSPVAIKPQNREPNLSLLLEKE
jgi:hypothetical protein